MLSVMFGFLMVFHTKCDNKLVVRCESSMQPESKSVPEESQLSLHNVKQIFGHRSNILCCTDMCYEA